jgi:hypothetical protein
MLNVTQPCLESVTMIMNNVTNCAKDDKPEFWLVEDGEFFLADPCDVYRCTVCNEWYLTKDVVIGPPICSPGCQLRSIETKKGA